MSPLRNLIIGISLELTFFVLMLVTLPFSANCPPPFFDVLPFTGAELSRCILTIGIHGTKAYIFCDIKLSGERGAAIHSRNARSSNIHMQQINRFAVAVAGAPSSVSSEISGGKFTLHSGRITSRGMSRISSSRRHDEIKKEHNAE